MTMPLARRALATFTLAAFLLVLLLRFTSSDCFLDGVVYACLARNLAQGQGTFWRLVYTPGMSPFAAHPPFALWLEAFAFRLAGDRPWVEAAWGMVMGLISLGALALLWRELIRALPGVVRVGAWWPMLLAAATPLFSWCLANNMLENTLVPLFLASSVGLVSAAREDRPARELGKITLGAGFLFLALLTKGPQAGFLLLLPLAVGLASHGRAVRALRQTLTLLAVMILLFMGTRALGGAEAGAFWHEYLTGQLLPSAQGALEQAASRGLVLRVLVRELLPALALTLVAAACGRAAGSRRSAAIALGLLGLAGVLPFLMFRKQMEWYVVPALPYFWLALAFAGAPGAQRFEAWVAGTARRGLGVALATLALLAACVPLGRAWGTLPVDLPTTLADAWRFAAYRRGADERQSEYTWMHFQRDVLDPHPGLPPGAFVSPCPLELHDEFRVRAYLQRRFRATLTRSGGAPFLLACNLDEPCCLSSDYQPLTRPGSVYTLYGRGPQPAPPAGGGPNRARVIP